MKLNILLAGLGLLVADAASADHARYGHLDPLDLYTQHTRVLNSERPEYFRVLVTPNLVPRPAALATAVGRGKQHCRQFGKTEVTLKKVQRHADQDITAWGMDFRCR